MTLREFWRALPREGRWLLSVTAFEFVGTGLVLPFWVVYLHEMRGFDLDTVGLLLATMPLGGFLASFPAGTGIDRIGPRRMLCLSLLLATVGQVVMTFAETVPLAFVGLLCTGASFGIGWPASSSLASQVVPSALRQRYFGANFTMLNLGIGLGGIIGGFAVDTDRLWTFQAMYLGDATSYLLPLAVLLGPVRHVGGPVPRDDEQAAPAVGYLGVLRRPAVPLMVVTTFVFGFVGYGQLNTGAPAFARVISEVSTRGLGFAFAANTLVIVVLQLALMRWIEARRRTRVLILLSLVWSASWLLLGASGIVPGTLGATLLVVACMAVFALGETLLQPTFPAIVNDLAPDDLRGRYNALFSSSFQLASISAPIAAGVFIDRGAGWWFVASLLAGLAVAAALTVRWERQLPAHANGGALPTPAPDTVVVPQT